MLNWSGRQWHVSHLQLDRDAKRLKNEAFFEIKIRVFVFIAIWTIYTVYKFHTTKCWKSHALITLVACFGRIPRFCRFEPELVDRLELKSSLIESISESPSSELLHGDNWSAGKYKLLKLKVSKTSREKKLQQWDEFRKSWCKCFNLHKDRLVMCIQFDWVVSSRVFAMKSLCCDSVNGHPRQYYRLMM